MNTVIKTTGPIFCLFFRGLNNGENIFLTKEGEFMKLIVFFAEYHYCQQTQ